jgi:hypothetical protein
MNKLILEDVPSGMLAGMLKGSIFWFFRARYLV